MTRTISSHARETLRLAAPLIIGQVATVAMGFVDTLMAGRRDAVSLAAIAVGGSLWGTLTYFIHGVLMALPPTVAQLRGSGRTIKIASWTWQTFWLGQALALLSILILYNAEGILALVGIQPEIVPLTGRYLKALCWGMPPLCAYLALRFLSEGLAYTRPSMYLGVMGLGVNVVANYALIYGRWGFPELGAVGCGYATSLVFGIQFLGMLIPVVRQKRFRSLDLLSGRELPRWPELRALLRLGLPMGTSIFIEASFFTSIALLMGSLGTTIVAGHQVAINFAALAFMVPLGLSLAITVRVAEAVGAGETSDARRAGQVGVGLALCTQLLSASVMLAVPGLIVAIYTRDPAVAEIALGLILLAAIFQIPDGLQVSAAGALRGLKDTRVPMVVTLISYWLVGLSLGYFLGIRLGNGAKGLWVGVIAGLSCAAVMLVWRFHRLSKCSVG
ncbi:MAG: MATE family efflux transporter [Acidobacteriota bacterium]|nr:MATE family efflux transporter [Acidobacteriota bacterium]